MSKYVYIKPTNVSQLEQELAAVNLTQIISAITFNGNVLTIETSRDLTASEFDILYKTVAKHNPAEGQLKDRVVSAISFGQSLIVEVAVENIMLQLTTGQIIQMLTKFAGIKAMLESGSLYTALAAMQTIKPDDTMTKERIDKYVNKLKKYLGV